MLIQSSLFTIDLKIDSQILKLKVNAEDCLSDLISNLATAITWKKIPSEKIKDRLQQQFKKLIEQDKVSGKVKNKLQDLLEQSKLVIVGIQNQSNLVIDETPFRILQESTVNGRKTHERLGKHYQYLNSNDYHLHNKYEVKQLKQQASSRKTDRQFERIVVKPKSPKKYNYCFENKTEDTLEGEAIRKKYEEIDRKCQDYIYRNLANSEEMKECYDRYRQSQLQRQAEGDSQHEKPFERSNSSIMQRYLKRRETQDTLYLKKDKRFEENRFISTQNVLNRDGFKNSDISGGESFQAYKMNRIKSTHLIHRTNSTDSTAQRETRKKLVNLSNREAFEDNHRYNNKGIIRHADHLELKRDYSNTNSASHLRRQGIHKKYQYDLEN